MTELLYIIKIATYFFLMFLMYFVVKKYKNKKIPLFVVLLFAFLFGLYAIWCGKYPYVSDRHNYAFRFEDLNGTYDYFVRSESTGLYVLEQILHLFTYDAKMLFFTIAFLFMFLILLAYRNSKNSTPRSFLFLMLTTFPIFSLFAIKQAMAMALLSLGYAFYTKEDRSKKDFFGSVACLTLAILFHEVAWIAVPLLILLRLAKNRHIKALFIIGVTIATIFFKQLSAMMVNIAIRLVPSLKGQLAIYLDSGGGIVESGSGMITTIKGIPFYFVLMAGLENRKKVKPLFGEYDSYLLLTLFVSATILLSGFMYWMFRFGLLFYMPVCDFAFIMYNYIDNKRRKTIFLFFTIFVSFIFSVRAMSQYYFLYGGI